MAQLQAKELVITNVLVHLVRISGAGDECLPPGVCPGLSMTVLRPVTAPAIPDYQLVFRSKASARNRRMWGK